MGSIDVIVSRITRIIVENGNCYNTSKLIHCISRIRMFVLGPTIKE